MLFYQNRFQRTGVRPFSVYSFSIWLSVVLLMVSGCERMQRGVVVDSAMMPLACSDGARVLRVGFYAFFPPVSYSATEDPDSAEFHTHEGYEAALLTALEAMDGAGLSFSRTPIPEWPGIWLKAAGPEFDMIGGGITALDSRTRDATGTTRIVFTSGHIKFQQSLLVRAEDAERLATHALLTDAVRVGVFSRSTGEARLLQLTGLTDAAGVLAAGTHIETPQGTLIADGTPGYKITAAYVSPALVERTRISPPVENMPQVIYIDDELGESALLETLAAGEMDAIARGNIGNQEAARASDGAFAVTALDEAVEYGGFAFPLEAAELAACVDEKINYLTDNRNLGYADWLQDPSVFMNRAEMWNAER